MTPDCKSSQDGPVEPTGPAARKQAAWQRLLRLGMSMGLGLGVGLLAACGGGSSSTTATTGLQAPTSGDLQGAEVTVLMMGNSHTSRHAVHAQLQALLQAGLGRLAASQLSPGEGFLDERVGDGVSLPLLRSRRWTAVVLQAQRYSTTGQFNYSTREAEDLVRAARAQGALPVLFPEWPRLGVPETQRIYALHVSIARQAPACVAPVGQAWDLARQRHPSLVLHASDGNHAAPAGAYLAALVLQATLSGAEPERLLLLPDLPVDVPAADQARLRQVAADAVRATPPRQHCPDDPRL